MNHIILKKFETPLGKMIAGSFQNKLCLLEFEDRYTINKIKLKKKIDYDAEYKFGTNKVLEETEKQITDYFSGKLERFSIPLSFKGSNFQLKVWEELVKIPYGETCSYNDIAKSIGNNKSVRAVGSANGANNLAIIVPCHRVIGSDGNLHGYGGGLWRKKKLLSLERKNKGQLKLDTWLN